MMELNRKKMKRIEMNAPIRKISLREERWNRMRPRVLRVVRDQECSTSLSQATPSLPADPPHTLLI
jgi:hypothetical protein